jgi:hypothetical protein
VVYVVSLWHGSSRRSDFWVGESGVLLLRDEPSNLIFRELRQPEHEEDTTPDACLCQGVSASVSLTAHLLRFERVDNLGAYSIPSETGLLIPSDSNSYRRKPQIWR